MSQIPGGGDRQLRRILSAGAAGQRPRGAHQPGKPHRPGWNVARGQGYQKVYEQLTRPSREAGLEDLTPASIVARASASNQLVGEQLSEWLAAVEQRGQVRQEIGPALHELGASRTAVAELIASTGPGTRVRELRVLRGMFEGLENSLAREERRLERDPVGLRAWATDRLPYEAGRFERGMVPPQEAGMEACGQSPRLSRRLPWRTHFRRRLLLK